MTAEGPRWTLRKLDPRWTTLRNLGNSPFVRLTILIPLVGYLVIFNDNVARMLALVPGLDDAKLVPSTNLILIYFGLVCIAAGAALYAIFCHEKVKHYGSANAYLGGDGPSISDRGTQFLEFELRDAGLGDEVSVPEQYLLSEGETKDAAWERYKRDLMHTAFDKWNSDFPYARRAAAALYALGFILLLIPSTKIFLRVLSILVRRISL